MIPTTDPDPGYTYLHITVGSKTSFIQEISKCIHPGIDFSPIKVPVWMRCLGIFRALIVYLLSPVIVDTVTPLGDILKREKLLLETWGASQWVCSGWWVINALLRSNWILTMLIMTHFKQINALDRNQPPREEEIKKFIVVLISISRAAGLELFLHLLGPQWKPINFSWSWRTFVSPSFSTRWGRKCVQRRTVVIMTRLTNVIQFVVTGRARGVPDYHGTL